MYTLRLFPVAIILLIVSACMSDNNYLKLHKRIFTIDTHCDTPMRLVKGGFDMGTYHQPGSKGNGQVDFPRMKEGGLDAQFFAVFTGQGPRTPEEHSRIKKYADQIIDSVYAACKRNSSLARIACSPDEALSIKQEGKIAILLGMENGYPLGKDLSNVEYFYNRGIRYITLCHTSNNEICDSSTDDEEWQGLSPFGEKVVREMNRLGMIIDLSHVSDSTFYDVIRLSKAPVIASHSSCRALCDHPRNLTDDMIKKLAENGGVIQICLVSSFVKKPEPNPERDAGLDSLKKRYGDYYSIKDPKIKEEYRNAYYKIRERYPVKLATMEDVVNHIDHVVKLVGINHVGIGSDFDGGGGVEGCNDVNELPNITKELLRRGYTEDDIKKIWGGNFLRVFRQVINNK